MAINVDEFNVYQYTYESDITFIAILIGPFNVLSFEQLNGDLRHLLDDVLIGYIECHIVLIFIGEVTLLS